jgi:hypothetical protein
MASDPALKNRDHVEKTRYGERYNPGHTETDHSEDMRGRAIAFRKICPDKQEPADDAGLKRKPSES